MVQGSKLAKCAMPEEICGVRPKVARFSLECSETKIQTWKWPLLSSHMRAYCECATRAAELHIYRL